MIMKIDICNLFQVSPYCLRTHISIELSAHIGMTKDDFIKHRGYFNIEISAKIKDFHALYKGRLGV